MKVERRLLSLVALLRRSNHAVTRAQIFAVMGRMDDGYPASHPEAARKKLGRDLRELRALGVVVRWDSVEQGYLLAPSARAPVSLHLDEDDAELLVESVRRLTDLREGTLAPRVEAALEQEEATELRRRGRPAFAVHEPTPPQDIALFESLVDACWHRRLLAFDYTTLDDRRARRAVEPWGVFRRHGAWHLLGRDRDRTAARSYRLSAIESLHVDPSAGAFEFPSGPQADVRAWATMEMWQWAVHPPVDVVLLCDEVSLLVARAVGGRVDGDRVTFACTNLAGVDDVVWDWAPRVRPLSPPVLAARFAAAVDKVGTSHKEGA